MTPEPLDRAAIEHLLRERAAALDVRLTGMAAAPERGSGISFGKRIGDGTTEAIRRLTDIGIGSTLETKQLRILRALEKLDDGTYGICDNCGSPITPARLRFAPESVLCITCAQSSR